MSERINELTAALKSVYAKRGLSRTQTQIVEEALSDLLLKEDQDEWRKCQPEGTALECTLTSLRGRNMKKMMIDEVFWENVEYLQFQSEFLYVRLKRGRPVFYLHHWVLEGMMDEEELNFDWEQMETLDWFRACRYVFPKENKAFLHYLGDESQKRNKWKEAW
ncbi:hypothetical protein B0533_06100 [Sedimentibacter sp. SX930]|nr:hypothetical protein B0533_06100 [Sedimentibacter sp. SX930]